MEGSLKLPWIARVVFYKYLIGFYKRMDEIVVVNPSFIPKLTAYNIPEEKFIISRISFPKRAFSQFQKQRRNLLGRNMEFRWINLQ